MRGLEHPLVLQRRHYRYRCNILSPLLLKKRSSVAELLLQSSSVAATAATCLLQLLLQHAQSLFFSVLFF
jgi:hypothetical protein